MSEIDETYEAGQNGRLSGEWAKFGVVAVILVGTILVMWALRPLIFNRIVPAIMGEGRLSTFIPLHGKSAVEQTPAVEGTESDQATEMYPTEQAPAPTDAYPAAPGTAPGEFPTSIPTQAHIVQPGETLTAIARQYGVTVEALIAANKITDPNQITAGDTLLIPQQ